MLKYPKLYPPFNRESRKPFKLIYDDWFYPEHQLLKDLPWVWTEKINGTSIRVGWNGYRVELGGRTDSAQINAKLVDHLSRSFPEEIFEQHFQSTPVVLFGEGVGPGIQSGGSYSRDEMFVLFDVYVEDSENNKTGGWWLHRENVVKVADNLNCSVVPLVGEFGIEAAIAGVEDGLESAYGSFMAEGIVGTAPLGLLRRCGNPLKVKVKRKDFPGE